MFRLEGHRIGDAWYFADGSTVHAWFLAMPLDRKTGWRIDHSVSDDLVHWEYQGTALEPGPPDAWDGKSLATGSVIRRDGRYWMAYTGHKNESAFVQRTGMAVSDDLATWRKLPENPTSVADPAHYEIESTGQRQLTHWRDPFLLDTGDRVLQYVCARRTEGDVAERGSIGIAQSTDMIHWEILPPPEHDRMTEEMEVPQVYFIEGRWYLVFCTHDFWLAPSFRDRFPGHAFRSTDYAMVGDSPLGPFRIHGTGEIMPEAPPGRFYASQLVEHGGSWFLLGTEGLEAESGISDPLPAFADETGIHVSRE